MSSDSSIWSVIAALASVFTLIATLAPQVYPKLKQWGSKKTLNLISGLGLVLTGFPMVGYSAYADSELYSFTGFIIPFTAPSIPHLTDSQASIFGHFANFFAVTLIIGGLGMMLGAFMLQRFHKLRAPNPGYIQ